MSPPHTNARETPDARYDHMILGEVVDNADPEGLGRVRVFVPGLLDPFSAWALPIGAMFGVRNGIYWVPEIGSNVVVWLNQGDVDHPYYAAGPHGKPDGESDVPPQAATIDHMVIRWKGFHITLNGREGQEKLTIQDLTSETRLDIDRTTGNFTRQVTGPVGSETATIKGDLTETVQTGNETHSVAIGGRTTTIAQNDAETIGGTKTKTVTGSETDTILGAKTETIGLAEAKTVGLGSVETVGAAKAITAGLSIAITAGAAIALQAGAGVSILGSSTSIQSTGPSTEISAGLKTSTLLGGLTQAIVGAVTKTVTGVWTMISVGTLTIVGAIIQLGAGPTRYRLVDERIFAAWANTHEHPPAGGPPIQKVLEGIPTPTAAPDVELTDVVTRDVTSS